MERSANDVAATALYVVAATFAVGGAGVGVWLSTLTTYNYDMFYVEGSRPYVALGAATAVAGLIFAAMFAGLARAVAHLAAIRAHLTR